MTRPLTRYWKPIIRYWRECELWRIPFLSVYWILHILGNPFHKSGSPIPAALLLNNRRSIAVRSYSNVWVNEWTAYFSFGVLFVCSVCFSSISQRYYINDINKKRWLFFFLLSCLTFISTAVHSRYGQWQAECPHVRGLRIGHVSGRYHESGKYPRAESAGYALHICSHPPMDSQEVFCRHGCGPLWKWK